MGIEALGIIGRIASIASVAPAMGRVASMGSLGMRMGAIGMPLSVSRIGNPDMGIGRMPSFFGGSKSMDVAMTPRAQMFAREFSPIKIANREVSRPQFRVPNVIAQAEAIVSRVQNKSTASVIEAPKRPAILDRKVSSWTGSVLRMPEPVRGLNVRVITNPDIKPVSVPKVELRPQVANGVVTENKTRPVTRLRNRVVPAPVSMPVQSEQVTEQRVKTDQKKEKQFTQKSEKTLERKVKLVEAVQISQKRKLEIATAIRRVTAEKSGVRITGRLVAKLLSHDFWKYKSPIVGEGKDGTIDSTVYDLEKDNTEYQTENEAQAGLVALVEKHIPVKQGEGGRTATLEEVREVLESKEKEIFRSNTPAEMVIKRVTKKTEMISQGKVIDSTESTIEDFPELAGVFSRD